MRNLTDYFKSWVQCESDCVPTKASMELRLWGKDWASSYVMVRRSSDRLPRGKCRKIMPKSHTLLTDVVPTSVDVSEDPDYTLELNFSYAAANLNPTNTKQD